MDGGVQLLGLAPDATRPAGPARATGSTMGQLRQEPAAPAGWAGLLTARVRQAAGLEAPRPAPAGAEPGWASRLKAHARSGWDKVEQARASTPAADPVALLADALQRRRQHLERERHRADAAEQGGEARIAAAEARVAVAGRQLREVQAVLARREAELGTAQGRIATIEGHLAGVTRRAVQAEGEAKAARAELRRLRMRGLWARILDLD